MIGQMIRTNEEEKKRIRERLAEIRNRLLTEGILLNPESDSLIRESNILNVKLKLMGG